jgi:superfamily II RNA helicase
MQQEYHEENIHKIAKFKKILNKYNIYMKKEYVINEVAKYLKNKGELPAIIYVYSRAGCYKLADSIKQSLFPEGSNAVHTIKKEAISILQKKLLNWQEYTNTIEFFKIVKRLEKGVAVHHSGVLQVYKEMIEILFADKKIPLLISTETFAVGLNMPVKTCVFTAFQKYSDKGFRNLTSSEYTQAAGRAGRRGLDKKGKNYHLVNLFRFGNEHLTPINYGHIVNGGYVSQQSKLEINFSYVLKQMYNKNDIEKHVMSSYGMCGKILDNEIVRIDDMKTKLNDDGFVEKESAELTRKGKIAICLQEIPCLAMADFIIRQEKTIEKLTPQDFIVIFSIFTNIRLSDENKIYNLKDIDISSESKLMLKKITGTLRYWKDIEINAFNKVDHYNIQYDICELVNKWTTCQNQNDCNAVFKELRYWGIFLGDFIKAILKINTIANEIEKAAILLENLSLVQKMKEIPRLTLKSIMTNKSLYL